MTESKVVPRVAEIRRLYGGELATEVLEIIEENLGRWDQGSWRHDLDDEAYCTAPVTAVEAFAEDPLNPACSTSFCFAGWVGALDGVKWAKGSSDRIGNPQRCTCTTYCCEEEHHQVAIDSYAAYRLGITAHQGDALFSGDNGLEDLRNGVEAIVAGTDVALAVRHGNGWDDGDSSDEYDDDEEDDDE